MSTTTRGIIVSFFILGIAMAACAQTKGQEVDPKSAPVGSPTKVVLENDGDTPTRIYRPQITGAEGVITESCV